MLGLVTALLPLLAQVVPGANSELISYILKALAAALPLIIQEVKDLAPTVKNIIDQLRGNAATTPEQLAELDAIEQPIDDAWDAAIAAAQAEDVAAANPPTT